MARHSWERAPEPWDLPADDPLGFGDDDEDSEGDGQGAFSEDEAGDILLECLFALLYRNKMSAKTLCVLCHWAAKAGAKGSVSKFGFRPGAPTGHFQRHIDTACGVNLRQESAKRYHIRAPGHDKYEVSRECQELVVTPPHEALDGELGQDVGALDEIKASLKAGDWPAAYWNHPVVVANPGVAVVPMALYLDAVPTTKKDAALGFFVYSLVSMKRHLCAVLQKSSLCKCGCRGWCTLFPVWQMLHWSFAALRDGLFPERDHLGQPFQAADPRGDLRGQPLVSKACLLYIKGDWAELSSTTGLPTWADAQSPCIFCMSDKSSMFDYVSWAPGSPPHGVASGDAYAGAVAGCERHVTMNERQWKLVRNSLTYDKSKAGSRGRCVNKDIDEVGLRKGDRLEPTCSLADVADFDTPGRFPFSATFWRRASETRARHNNPLFHPDIGVGVHTLAIDTMHTIFLGVAQEFVVWVFWFLIDANAFDLQTTRSDGHIQLSVAQLRDRLWDWYAKFEYEHPDVSLTRVQDLTAGMLGTRARKKLHTKAMETRWLVPFAVDMLARFQAKLGSRVAPLLAIGRALLGLIDIMATTKRAMPAADAQKFFDLAQRLTKMWEVAGLSWKPKNHLLLEMASRTADFFKTHSASRSRCENCWGSRDTLAFFSTAHGRGDVGKRAWGWGSGGWRGFWAMFRVSRGVKMCFASLCLKCVLRFH